MNENLRLPSELIPLPVQQHVLALLTKYQHLSLSLESPSSAKYTKLKKQYEALLNAWTSLTWEQPLQQLKTRRASLEAQRLTWPESINESLSEQSETILQNLVDSSDYLTESRNELTLPIESVVQRLSVEWGNVLTRQLELLQTLQQQYESSKADLTVSVQGWKSDTASVELAYKVKLTEWTQKQESLPTSSFSQTDLTARKESLEKQRQSLSEKAQLLLQKKQSLLSRRQQLSNSVSPARSIWRNQPARPESCETVLSEQKRQWWQNSQPLRQALRELVTLTIHSADLKKELLRLGLVAEDDFLEVDVSWAYLHWPAR
jgi:hypothetical protein